MDEKWLNILLCEAWHAYYFKLPISARTFLVAVDCVDTFIQVTNFGPYGFEVNQLHAGHICLDNETRLFTENNQREIQFRCSAEHFYYVSARFS